MDNETWDKNLALLYRHRETGEKLKYDTVFEGENIGSWAIISQKGAFKDGTLSAERVAKLLEFDKDFFKSQKEIDNEKWDNNLALLYKHRETGEKLKFDTVFEGENIGSWCNTQRGTFRNRTLPPEKVVKLLEFDVDFFKSKEEINQEKWDNNLALLYKHRETGEKLTQKTVFEDENIGSWCNTQRGTFRNRTLPPEKVAKLLEFDKDFFKSREEMDNETWDKNLALLYRHRETGEKLTHKTVFEGENIGSWIGNQRSAFKDGTLPPEKVAKLLEFDKDFFGGRDTVWDNNLALLYKHRETGEKLKFDTVFEGENIGSWAFTSQRKAFRNRTLPPEKVAKLLEFDKDFFKSQEEINQENWDEKLALLYRHRETGEKLAHRTVFEGENIGSWAFTSQRKAFRNRTLPPEKVAKLLEFDKDFFGVDVDLSAYGGSAGKEVKEVSSIYDIKINDEVAGISSGESGEAMKGLAGRDGVMTTELS